MFYITLQTCHRVWFQSLGLVALIVKSRSWSLVAE